MVHSLVRPQVSKSDQGFTLMEILIALLIAGILAAFSLPSLLGILSSNQLKSAQDQVQAALRDAQRQAIRRSKSCSLTIDTSSDPVVLKPTAAADADCFASTNRELPQGITVTSSNGYDFEYSFKGHTNDAATLRFSSDNSNQKRCIAISMHLGILRTGIVDANNNCKTSTSTL